MRRGAFHKRLGVDARGFLCEVADEYEAPLGAPRAGALSDGGGAPRSEKPRKDCADFRARAGLPRRHAWAPTGAARWRSKRAARSDMWLVAAAAMA